MNVREKAALIHKAKQNNPNPDLEGPDSDAVCKCRHKQAVHSAINPLTQAHMCKYASCHCKEFRPYTQPAYSYSPAEVQAEEYLREKAKQDKFVDVYADKILHDEPNFIKPMGFSMKEVEDEAKRTGRPVEEVHAEFVRRHM